MAGTSSMVWICTFSYLSPYSIKKVGDSPYSYPYPVNAEIFHQNMDEFEQYSLTRQVYLQSLICIYQNIIRIKIIFLS